MRPRDPIQTMRTPSEVIDGALSALGARVREDPVLTRELETSTADFFGGPPPSGTVQEAYLAARRHLEWFLLERHSPALYGVPVERLGDRWCQDLGDDEQAIEFAVTSLRGSFSGVFEVAELAPQGGGSSAGVCWVRDLAGLGTFALTPTAHPVAVGDLLVGRLFPLPDGSHELSLAGALFRESSLREALEIDLARAREGGGPSVLRLSQLELERLFWGADAPRSEGDPIGAARRFLEDGGLEPAEVERVLALLAAQPLRPDRLVYGAGDVLGEILDELAFETELDLEQARRLLQLAWGALSPQAPSSAAREEPAPDVREALAAFERGRAAGRDLEQLFSDLERDLALAPGSARDEEMGESEEEGDPAPEFPGVVGAMVDEFLWEVEREGSGDAARRFACLRSLGEYGSGLGSFEELGAGQLLRFTTFWIHEHGTLGGKRDARQLLDALEAFSRWADEAHHLELRRDFGPTLVSLRGTLPRIAELNRLLPPPPEDATGELFDVRRGADGRYGGLRDRRGRDHSARPAQGLAERLRPGDHLRGSISLDGTLSIYRCYPPEAAELRA